MVPVIGLMYGTRILWKRSYAGNEIIEGKVKEFSANKKFVHIDGALFPGWYDIDEVIVLETLNDQGDKKE